MDLELCLNRVISQEWVVGLSLDRDMGVGSFPSVEGTGAGDGLSVFRSAAPQPILFLTGRGRRSWRRVFLFLPSWVTEPRAGTGHSSYPLYSFSRSLASSRLSAAAQA